MFNSYIFLLAGILVGYVFMLKVNYGWLVASEYRESLNFIYPLGLSAVIFAIAAFFDMGYQCAKDTSRTLPAIVLSAVINVILNFMLIKPLGVYGVILTQVITYTVLFTYRWHDMRRYFVLKSSSRSLVPVIVMLLSAIPFYYCDGIVINIAYMALAIGAIIAACNKELRDLLLSKFSK
jgi:O-antigen/teichoic acid export membrane protein